MTNQEYIPEYVRVPKPEPSCNICIWLNGAINDAANDDLDALVVMGNQVFTVHRLQFHQPDVDAPQW